MSRLTLGFPGGTSSKELPATHRDLRDVGSIPGSGKFPRGGHGNPLQYSYLENPMDREAWQATVHRVTQSRTPLNQQHTCTRMGVHTHTHTHTHLHIYFH